MSIPKIKICGITRVEDALCAATNGADFLGYVFFARSARNVAVDQAAAIIETVRSRFPLIQHVGVFVDESLQGLLSTARRARLDFVQMHGQEPPELAESVRKEGVGTIKAFRYGTGAPPCPWQEYNSDYFLCDTYDKAAVGGTGRSFNPDLLPEGFPLERSFFAGGLQAESVGELLKRLSPFALDVSSGVELSPGIKSPELIERFIAQVRFPCE